MSDVPIIGKVYKVIHTRKGTFFMRVTEVIPEPDGWTKGIITEGIADAIMNYNIKCIGDTINVRNSLALFYLVEEK